MRRICFFQGEKFWIYGMENILIIPPRKHAIIKKCEVNCPLCTPAVFTIQPACTDSCQLSLLLSVSQTVSCTRHLRYHHSRQIALHGNMQSLSNICQRFRNYQHFRILIWPPITFNASYSLWNMKYCKIKA